MSVLTYGRKINQQDIATCIYIICLEYVNPLTPSDAYMRQKTIPSLVVRRQPIGLLSIRPKRTYFNEILFKIQKFSFKKMHMKMFAKMAAILSRPQCVNQLRLRQWAVHAHYSRHVHVLECMHRFMWVDSFSAGVRVLIPRSLISPLREIWFSKHIG